MCYILCRALRGQLIVNVKHIRILKVTKLHSYATCKLLKPKKNNSYRSLFQGAKNLKSLTTTETMNQNSMFKGQTDRFNGITIDSSKEPCDVGDFIKKLEVSLKHWIENSYRGIWFKVFLEHADWVPVLAKNDFQFHHAKPEYVMMYRWLPSNEVCNIPPFAHTMIGVGAVVINDANEILVVREKYFLIPHWKLPGGYVEPGEDIGDAAIREVYEETNIKSEFQFLISLRHTHSGMFRCSDIYFVVGLKPISCEIAKCDREIAACEWMKVEDFLNHPNVHETNRFFVSKYLEYLKHQTTIKCLKGTHPLLKKPQCVFSIDFDPSASSHEELPHRKPS